ncbi:MAG TPA: thioesterase domain-containing protein [Bacteriovoracaceae bacterium]|nr:thioesterase domain-containing protein [Bacteriovoracaceae bacterium]
MKAELNTNLPYPKPSSVLAKTEALVKTPTADIKAALKPSPDYKLDLSSKGVVPIPVLPSPVSLATEVIKEAATPKASVKEIKSSQALEVNKRDGSLKKPAIFFIKGMDIFSSPSRSEGGYTGVRKIAESIEGSRIYGWDQKDEIIKEIKKVHPDYPVILMGHSLGGDTAVEVAQELDSLEQKFRTVDLLITMDAVGFGHDIIPQNVKKHLNVFGENSGLLNDGPHVARREEKTQVRNILSPLAHTDLDDNSEIQFEIVNLIQETLNQVKK